MRAYDEIADWYAAARRPDVGTPEVGALAQTLKPGARVLDLGCGTGLPLAAHLARRGFRVVGLDSAPAMIERFRANVPGAEAHCARVQDARFPPETFDAVVAWGVLFHLDDADQEAVIAHVAGWLAPGGWFLFTGGGAEGWTEGTMNGAEFHYRSLGEARYRALLKGAGLAVESVHTDAWENVITLARKAV